MNTIRRENLREYIKEHDIVTLAQLAQLFPGISLMTIHRDLNFLQEQGFIEKIRGGARYRGNAASEGAFAAREIVARKAKERIAQKAVGLLEGASSIFLDAGTTMLAFAKALPDQKLSAVTTGPNIALELAKRKNVTVSMCGGTLNKSNLTLSGAAAIEALTPLNIDMAFLAPSGYGEQAGFTCGMESEAHIKSLMISKARTVVMLMDSSKLERVLPYTFARVEEIDCLVTERDPGVRHSVFRNITVL